MCGTKDIYIYPYRTIGLQFSANDLSPDFKSGITLAFFKTLRKIPSASNLLNIYFNKGLIPKIMFLMVNILKSVKSLLDKLIPI